VDISHVIKAIIAPLEERHGSGSLPSLLPGDRLVGRVLRLENDGRILIDLDGRRALAQAAFEVTPGQLLKLQVVESGPPLHLRVDGGPAWNAAPMKPAGETPGGLTLSERQELLLLCDKLIASEGAVQGREQRLPQEIRHSLMVIKEFLAPLMLSRSAEQVAVALRQLVEEGGVLYERKVLDLLGHDAGIKSSRPAADPAAAPAAPAGLMETPPHAGQESSAALRRDLKPNLLLLKAFLEKASTAMPSPPSVTLDHKELLLLRRGITQMLANIDQQQERIVQRSGGSDHSQMVIHWLPIEEQNRPVGLKIHYPKAGSGRSPEEQVFRVALLLQMDRLGPVHVELALLARGLRIDFHVCDARMRDTIEAHMGEIREALGAGFESLTLAAHISGERVTRFLHEEGVCAGAATQIDLNA
jgi:hypothetical protein